MRRALVVLVLMACSGSERARVVQPTPVDAGPGAPRMVLGHYFVAGDAPDPLACGTDADCLAGVVTDENGCCIRSAAPQPQTWLWHDWSTARRLGDTCKAASCPAVAAGELPLACKVDIRCLAGRCATTCDR